MQLPQLTLDQIRHRCTEQSFERGLAYFHAGAIGNPVLHAWTLSATCQGSSAEPYRVTVELMPTGILSTHCSCLYSGHGDCKHRVALLHTYLEAPETICSIENLLTTLAVENRKSNLLHSRLGSCLNGHQHSPPSRRYTQMCRTRHHTQSNCRSLRSTRNGLIAFSGTLFLSSTDSSMCSTNLKGCGRMQNRCWHWMKQNSHLQSFMR